MNFSMLMNFRDLKLAQSLDYTLDMLRWWVSIASLCQMIQLNQHKTCHQSLPSSSKLVGFGKSI
jgi:hypothetical protein